MDRLRIVLEEPSPETTSFFEWGLHEAVAERFGIACSIKRSAPDSAVLPDLLDNFRITLRRASEAGAAHLLDMAAYVTGGVIKVKVGHGSQSIAFTVIAITRGKHVIDASIAPCGEIPEQAAQAFTYIGVGLEQIRPVSPATPEDKKVARELITTIHTAVESVREALKDPTSVRLTRRLH